MTIREEPATLESWILNLCIIVMIWTMIQGLQLETATSNSTRRFFSCLFSSKDDPCSFENSLKASIEGGVKEVLHFLRRVLLVRTSSQMI